MTRSLCIRRGALGDTLVMIPLLRAMRRVDPSAELHFAGVEEYAHLLLHYGVVDEGFSVERLHLWALHLEHPSGSAAREMLQRYDWIVADDPGLEGSGLRGRVQVFDPKVREAGPGAAPAQLLARAHLVADRDDASPRLRAVRAPVTRELVFLHPGSGGTRKCWPWRAWMELAAMLQRMGRDVVVVLGEAEPRAPALPPGVTALERAPLLTVAQRLERAACFAGNDSGMTHLAAALSVPTVAVFGPTDPKVWAPIGAHVTVVGERTTGAPDAPVSVVAAAVAAALARDS